MEMRNVKVEIVGYQYRYGREQTITKSDTYFMSVTTKVSSSMYSSAYWIYKNFDISCMNTDFKITPFLVCGEHDDLINYLVRHDIDTELFYLFHILEPLSYDTKRKYYKILNRDVKDSTGYSNTYKRLGRTLKYGRRSLTYDILMRIGRGLDKLSYIKQHIPDIEERVIVAGIIDG